MEDWIPMSPAELYQEHADYEFGARYDRFDGYREDDYPEDYDDPVFGCGFQEREQAAAAFCRALMVFRYADDDIPF